MRKKKGADLSNLENSVMTGNCKAKDKCNGILYTLHKHCTLVDKFVSHGLKFLQLLNMYWG